jgi:hypothetical protein
MEAAPGVTAGYRVAGHLHAVNNVLFMFVTTRACMLPYCDSLPVLKLQPVQADA